MRSIQPEYFHWLKPHEAAFEWQNHEAFVLPTEESEESRRLAGERRFLVDTDPTKPRYRAYSPLETDPDLFAVFARIEPTREAFAAFANQYGNLGVAVMLMHRLDENTMTMGSVGEPFYRWEEAHAQLKKIANIVLAIRDRDVEKVRPWIRVWETGARFEWQPGKSPHRGMALICETKHGHRTELWKWACEAKSENEKLLRLASGYAQEVINKALGGDPTEQTCSTSRLLFDVERQSISMFLVPNSLLAALWLQCARALTADPQQSKTCEMCGEPYSVSAADGRRRDARYCSDRCKVAAHRQRKAITEAAHLALLRSWRSMPVQELASTIKVMAALSVSERAIRSALGADKRFTQPENDHFGLVAFAHGKPGNFSQVD